MKINKDDGTGEQEVTSFGHAERIYVDRDDGTGEVLVWEAPSMKTTIDTFADGTFESGWTGTTAWATVADLDARDEYGARRDSGTNDVDLLWASTFADNFDVDYPHLSWESKMPNQTSSEYHGVAVNGNGTDSFIVCYTQGNGYLEVWDHPNGSWGNQLAISSTSSASMLDQYVECVVYFDANGDLQFEGYDLNGNLLVSTSVTTPPDYGDTWGLLSHNSTFDDTQLFGGVRLTEEHPVNNNVTWGSTSGDGTADNTWDEPFDSTDYETRWPNQSNNSDGRTIVSDVDRGNVLELEWLTDAYYGWTSWQIDTDLWGYEPQTAYSRYWVKFDPNWEFAGSATNDVGLGGTKIPGTAGTYDSSIYDSPIEEAGWGGRESTGENGWSHRPHCLRPDRSPYHSSDIPFGSQIYAVDEGEKTYNDTFAGQTWNSGNYAQTTTGGAHGYHPKWVGTATRGTWHQIDEYVRLNTPGVSDGVVRCWLDGNKALDMDNLKFRNSGRGDIRMMMFWGIWYFGGDWGSPKQQTVRWDDLNLWVWEDQATTDPANPDPAEVSVE